MSTRKRWFLWVSLAILLALLVAALLTAGYLVARMSGAPWPASGLIAVLPLLAWALAMLTWFGLDAWIAKRRCKHE